MTIPLEPSDSPYMKSVAPKCEYTHEAMADYILTHPGCQQVDIAKHFGRTRSWISVIMNSDSFQALFEARRKEVVDPTVIASIEEKLKATAQMSLDIILEKLDSTRSTDLALKALELSSRSLGYGAAKTGGGNQFNFVVALPGKAQNADDWAAAHRPGPKTIEPGG
jgi:hypothetical protein